MNAKREKKDRITMGGAVDEALFKKAILDNMSPDGVAAAICFLRCAEFGDRPTSDRTIAALREVEWLADTLTELLGVDEHDRLVEELGF